MGLGVPPTPTIETIMQEIEATGEINGAELQRRLPDMSPNTIYRVLDRLENARWVSSRYVGANGARTRSLRMFKLTCIGSKIQEIVRLYDT